MMPNTVNVEGKKVFVGLSGGVDSAVTATLLKEAGANVTGVFIKGWYPEGLPCTWASDRRDAMRVAAHLEIPFSTLDASAAYKKAVIDYLIREYGSGRTPNPDIFCNRDVKFGAFFDYALKEGADYIATGHYAKTESGRLFQGADDAKDQSYFLWAIPKDALTKTLFPLGNMRKEEVRAIAARKQLPVADKKDSQGICFLGAVSIEEFLRHEFSIVSGEARDEEGLSVGTHDGALLYTLGERAPLRNAPEGPWYVVKKDIERNLLIVSKRKEVKAAAYEIRLQDTNFFTQPTPGALYSAQYRYHGPKILGTYTNALFTPQEALYEPLAEGQSFVLYDHDECLGGGIIS